MINLSLSESMFQIVSLTLISILLTPVGNSAIQYLVADSRYFSAEIKFQKMPCGDVSFQCD